uniref:RNA-binding motif protein, X chromosome isoform X4 n=1 Tax=Geotrypetes seraphini TaxID=260995 RepID=A0A6P8R431_GEOSA|nr:RNA-binding motif protein, X chromosome isoform X4 [Geotrypetes seraphini]
MESLWMANPLKWNKPQSLHLKLEDEEDHLLLQEVVVLQEVVLEVEEEEVEDQELLCHVKGTAMAHPEGIHCHLEEMYISLQEMMVTVPKTVTQAEIILVQGTQEIMLHLPEIMPTEIMVIPVLVMIMDQGDIVNVMVMGVIGTMLIIQDLTEIHMSHTVTHVVLHLHEGPHHHMVEAVDMMITAALEMDMEAVTVTQAEVISTQVGVIVLADKSVFPLAWKGAILPHEIHTAAQVVVHPEVVAVEAAVLIEAVPEADIKFHNLDHTDFLFMQTKLKWKVCLYQRTTERKFLFIFFIVSVKHPSFLCFCEERLNA